MASAPPAISAVARPSRSRSTAPTIGGEARRFLVADGHVRAAQLELEPGEAGGGIRRPCCRTAAPARRPVRCETGRRGTAAWNRRRPSRCRARRRCDRRRPAPIDAPRVVERELRRGDGVDAGAIHPPHLHRRDPRRRVEAGDLAPRASCGSPVVSNPLHRRDAAAALEQRVAKRRVRRAERRHDADARHAHGSLHAPYVTIAAMSVPTRRTAMLAITVIVALGVLVPPRLVAQKTSTARQTDAFDELYTRGKKANAAMKTLTARFTETTTSSLLTRPLVARGRRRGRAAVARGAALHGTRCARRPDRRRQDDDGVAWPEPEARDRHRHRARARPEVLRRRHRGRSPPSVRHRGSRHQRSPRHLLRDDGAEAEADSRECSRGWICGSIARRCCSTR